MLGFLRGAFVELLQLTLVFAAACLGAVFFGGPLTAAPPGEALSLLAIYAVYCLFAIVPARDLVQGWLGIVAHRRPERYDDRGENAGRGVIALAGSIAMLVLLATTFGAGREDASTQAFGLAYVLLAVIVFGIAGAVPRLYFAAFSAAPERSGALPDLLREAGTRGARFVACAFIGIGGALVAARLAVFANPVVEPSVAPPPVPLAAHELYWGELCTQATATCPVTRHVTIHIRHAGALAVELTADGEPPACDVTPRAGASVHPGEVVGVDVTLPAGAARCSYLVELAEKLP